MTKTKKHLSLFIITIFLTCWAGMARAATPLVVKDIRFGQHADRTRVVIDLSKKTDFRAFVLDHPYRVVVDLPPAEWRTPHAGFGNGEMLRGFRSGQLKNGLTRIVFDAQKRVLVDKAFTLPPEGDAPNRLVVDLMPASRNLFNARKDDVAGNRNLAPPAGSVAATPHSDLRRRENAMVSAVAMPATMTTLPRPKPHHKIYTIVLDAGHGGKDPDAIGINHVKEKNITLSIVRELKRQLEETGHYRVLLTRDGDYYVRLRARVAYARKHHADMFISIHANKYPDRIVRGAAIYTLSEKASDKETARLAHSENYAGVVAGVDLKQEKDDVAGILLDLAMREKMNESNVLAHKLANAFRLDGVRLLHNTCRSAGFAVLKAPDIPAVLIETGFVSNPVEARLLTSPQFQRKISAAIVSGVNAYFRKIEALNRS